MISPFERQRQPQQPAETTTAITHLFLVKHGSITPERRRGEPRRKEQTVDVPYHNRIIPGGKPQLLIGKEDNNSAKGWESLN